MSQKVRFQADAETEVAQHPIAAFVHFKSIDGANAFFNYFKKEKKCTKFFFNLFPRQSVNDLQVFKTSDGQLTWLDV